MGQALINWAKNNINNGYFGMVDVHHGTELFLGFLPRYIDIFPDDQNAKNLILDVAEHIGNWSKNSNDWFDYSNNNLSALVRNKIMSRDRAWKIYTKKKDLDKPLLEYFLKRLKLTKNEYQNIMDQKPRYWTEFRTYKKRFEFLSPIFS